MYVYDMTWYDCSYELYILVLYTYQYVYLLIRMRNQMQITKRTLHLPQNGESCHRTLHPSLRGSWRLHGGLVNQTWYLFLGPQTTWSCWYKANWEDHGGYTPSWSCRHVFFAYQKYSLQAIDDAVHPMYPQVSEWELQSRVRSSRMHVFGMQNSHTADGLFVIC